MAGKAGNKKSAAQPAAQSQFQKAVVRAGMASKTGKSAVQAAYHSQVVLRTGYVHTHSVDLDTHFTASEPNSARWDYGLGLRTSNGIEMAVWLEPHPASSGHEVDKMLSKLAWLKGKLDTTPFAELRSLRDAAALQAQFPYRWLVTPTGAICISPNSKEARRLALAGLDQPRRRVQLP